MVINLTTLEGKMNKVEVAFMGQSCKVTYDPLKITTDWMEKAQSSDSNFALQFCDAVKAWDVQSTTGRKIPLTPAGLKGVPVVLLRDIYGAITSGVSTEVEEQGKDSSDG